MRLEKASYKAIKYACLNFHYAKSVPNVGLAYSVFNDKNEWCGVVCFGVGAVKNIGNPYGLKQGQVIELLRMALNGGHGKTSKLLSTTLKLISKVAPNVKLIVSYADSEQDHYGIIYQATNWFYTGFSIDSNLIVNGKREHRRSVASRLGNCSSVKLRKQGYNIRIIRTKPKYKYIYTLDKSLIPLCKSLSKPYPKRGNSINGNASVIHTEEHVRGDVAAQNEIKKKGHPYEAT